ncbi:MAG TPA: prolipoprotein diacylglyceryl transferase [Polyangiaceae bacterium]|nr:prolipoprotein diacylglyceryl transferase [Polyangiaceae bacterium]
MHPILFRIPLPGWKLPYFGVVHNIPIYSYGVMLGLSLVVGWYLTLYLSERDGLPKETMANCYVVTAISAIIGSRLLYVLTNLDEFQGVGDFFAFRRGGLVAYGGFLGGYLGSWLYLKRQKIALMPWADVAVPSLASGLLITRIGCYLFGCDFGKPLSASAPQWLQKIGSFPHWPAGTLEHGEGAPAWVHHVQHYGLSIDATHSNPVHPTQLYESLIGGLLLALLLWQRKHQRFRGQVFMLFAFGYGFLRFLIEMVRDDAERGVWGPHLTADVLIPGALALFAIGYAISFARAIDNVTMRRLTQVISFVPAIVAYLALKPASYVSSEMAQLSTSQWVGVATAVAVAIAFGVFWKVAEAHPEQAMALDLTGFYALEKARSDAEAGKVAKSGGGRKSDDDDEDDEDDEDRDEDEKKKPAAKDDAIDAKFDDDKPSKDDKKPAAKDDAIDAKFDDDKPSKDEDEKKSSEEDDA